jgi:hypothetical protein
VKEISASGAKKQNKFAIPMKDINIATSLIISKGFLILLFIIYALRLVA